MDIEKYSKNIQFYLGEIPPLLFEFLEKSKWKTYLDLGCGDGALLYALNKKGYFKDKLVYAIDLSKNRINLVKKINKNFKCFLDDACNTSLEDNAIDFLLSTDVIEHVSDDEDMICEINRVLAPKGTVYLTTVFKKWYGWYFYRCNGKWTLDPTHVREYSNDRQLLDVLRKHNLEIIVNKKSLVWRPIINFFLRRMSTNRHLYDNSIFKLLRNFKIPILGYYNWKIICKKIQKDG